MKILKFGGTSVGSPNAFLKVFDAIISNTDGKCVVVLSAVTGTTDKLLEATNQSINNLEQSFKILSEVKNKHLDIVNKLFEDNINLDNFVNSIFNDINNRITAYNNLGELTSYNISSVVSYGEILSSRILFELLQSKGVPSQLLDSRELIATDNNYKESKVDYQLTYERFVSKSHIFETKNVFITQGFLGSCNKGKVSLLGRGGSDYSASLFGFFLNKMGHNIEEIQIWTDVSGVLSADPRIVTSSKTIKSMSYDEIRILSYLGAKVLHPDTIKPAISANIPLRVMNTFSHDNSLNTLILGSDKLVTPSINSLILIDNCYELKIFPDSTENGFSTCERIYNLLRNSGNKIYLKIASEEVIKVYLKENPAPLLNITDNISFSINYISLLAFTGYNVSKMINIIYNSLDIFNLSIVAYTDNCCYLKCSEKFEIEKLNRLHNFVFDNYSQKE